MAGLYLHIPFCVKRCLYCDFFSNTRMDFKQPFIHALCREMELRRDYLEGEPLETIYFGGGTPSQLSADDFSVIFDAINRSFDLSGCKEITLEANPDDMTAEYAASIASLPFNRVSMGVQSFKTSDLKFLNRRHDRQQAFRAVENCKNIGINNISIDLIYGLPSQTIEDWEKNLDEAISLGIPHISAYHLIYEEGTALYRLMDAGKVRPIDEDVSLDLFKRLISRLKSAGYEHYEISNFARPGFYSSHNSSYWKGKKYLGLGPSAHSYNGSDREWNVSSISDYIGGIENDSPKFELEKLDKRTKYNDYVITGLRTKWGISLNEIERQFGTSYRDYCFKMAQHHLQSSLLSYKNDVLCLTPEGIFISDSIMSDLLNVD